MRAQAPTERGCEGERTAVTTPTRDEPCSGRHVKCEIVITVFSVGWGAPNVQTLLAGRAAKSKTNLEATPSPANCLE
jgi:hypothetical protein